MLCNDWKYKLIDMYWISKHNSVEIFSFHFQASFGSLFSASMNAEHTQKMELLKSMDNILISTMKTCYVYQVDIDMFAPPLLHPSFLKAIRMTKTDSASDVAMFVAQYGTHFFKSLRMGYRKGLDSIMSKTQFTNVESLLNSFGVNTFWRCFRIG